ncbi:hypothetical protein [Rhizobium rhizogenes]|uniref:hypothetical protein n=1 Tax=Rhizobium rhizogenes TaxID=359 RepID=UPI00157411A0|nr:hypothetical protein [Rhizobium rhizogenes]NTF44393.1 hypothetical protein [Rhizobium rhizogenes]
MTKHQPVSATVHVASASKTPKSNRIRSDKGDKTAYERGADAGRNTDSQPANPYPDGSDAAKTFEHGQLDAQKVRSNDKPPGR